MRIGEVPMKCSNCGVELILDDCDIDDPFGDGGIGCPLPDCGGLMTEANSPEANAESKP